MRICTYNIEWMDGLFHDGKLRLDREWSRRRDVVRVDQANAIAEVLRMIDADLFVILEAPNEYEKGACQAALEKFARHYGLRQSRARIGYSNHTDQEIALLYDPDRVQVEHRPRAHKSAPRFNDKISLEIAGKRDNYRFSKPPIEARIKDLRSGFQFMLFGAHFKTKAPHGAKNDEQAIKIGLENRRKQVAQATWLRRRIEATRGPILACGDFNDGPGFDELESFNGASSIDVLTDGLLWAPQLDNPEKLSTSRFHIWEDDSFKEALLDFVLVNDALEPYARKWRIWHPLTDRQLAVNPKYQWALLTASDHFPVTLDLNFDGN